MNEARAYLDGISDTMMRGWKWTEESMTWLRKDRDLLHEMSDLEYGYYVGIFDAFAYANGLHEDGISHHRLPEITMGNGLDRFNYRKFLAVFGIIDDEGHIFLPGTLAVRSAVIQGQTEVMFWLHCTESVISSDPREKFPDVSWGMKESLEVWANA